MATDRKPTQSAPSLVLAAHGIRIHELGEAIGRSRSHTSMMLSGTRTVDPRLVDAVRRLGGPDIADEFTEALDRQRAQTAAS